MQKFEELVVFSSFFFLLSAKDSEKLTDEACRKLVCDAVEKYAVGGAPVILCGIGMSAYVILKAVAAIKVRQEKNERIFFHFFLSQTRKVFGLVLIGATKNHYRPSKLMLKGIGVLYKVCCFFRDLLFSHRWRKRFLLLIAFGSLRSMMSEMRFRERSWKNCF